MNKSKFKFFGLSFLFALLMSFSVDMNAQTDADFSADISDFTAYPAGTFEGEATFVVLNTEMDGMTKGQAVTAEYRYYWLVAVDIKRNNVSVEEALVNNLGAIASEFSSSISELETLYQETVDKL